MIKNRIVAASAALLVGLGGAAAEEPKERPRVQKSQHIQAELEREAEEMLAAVVRVRMKAIPNARSNTTLGSSREGTGVVIDERGHIVTIGYIVIEADSIEITTRDERTVPATLVGYDHASGFGLLRSGAPLGVKPMPMGLAADLAMREAVMVLPAGGRDAASLAYVVSRRKFAASWEYLLETAIFTAPPTPQWAGAALVSREGKLVGIGSLYVRETQESGSEIPGNMFVPIDLLKPIRRPHRERTQERACASVAGSRDRGAARSPSRDACFAGGPGGQGRGQKRRYRRGRRRGRGQEPRGALSQGVGPGRGRGRSSPQDPAGRGRARVEGALDRPLPVLQGKAGLLDFLHGMLAAMEHEPGLVVVGDGGFLTEGSIGSVQRPARGGPVPGARLRATHLAHVDGERVSAQANFDFSFGAMRIVEAQLPLYILDACLTVVQISHSRLNRDHRSGSCPVFGRHGHLPQKKSA